MMFTIEEVVEIYNPTASGADYKGMINAVKITKGYASFDEQGELQNMFVDDVRIDNKQTRPSERIEARNDSMIKKLLKRLIK
ncbi:hypothetical protein [Brevibacillus brevis]|uniref:hypothetical protein n=1 Tax=Brevibacillus brevis TaxID=1393 RepID=UPI0007D8AA7C|nr:hypothetical protein [Brevibacillus brevis]